MKEQTKTIRIALYVIGIILVVTSFYFTTLSELKPITINGITIHELFYPYRIQGYIIFFAGTILESIGAYYPNIKNFIKKRRTPKKRNDSPN